MNPKTKKWKITRQSSKMKKRKIKRSDDTLWDLWDNIKQNTIHLTGIPEREEREKSPEKLFEEIMAEKFPNLGKETDTQVQEAQRVQIRRTQREAHQDTLSLKW